MVEGERTARRVAPPEAGIEGVAAAYRDDAQTRDDLDSIVGFMADELGAEAAFLSLRDRAHGVSTIVCAHGLWREWKGLGEEIDQPVRWEAHDGAVDDVLVAQVRSPSGRSGALAVGFPHRLGSKRPLAVEVMASYAGLVGLWLDDAGALQRLLRAAYRDALTDCLSFAALTHELEREVKRARRSDRPLSCLFLDLDGFKQVNDTDGHQAGNRVLAAAASSLMARARQTDIVGRYGGDEFVVVLPETDVEGAATLADSLAAEVADATHDVLGRRIPVSIGVAQWEPEMGGTDLLEAADAALREQRAPRLGRDARV
jgi:diguanylate cyclase (GGDEF)-like protein